MLAQLYDGDVVAKVNATVGSARRLVGDMANAGLVRYAHDIALVASAMMHDLQDIHATARVDALLSDANITLAEARQSLEQALGNGITVQLGHGSER